jgi:hypothetical protein
MTTISEELIVAKHADPNALKQPLPAGEGSDTQ